MDANNTSVRMPRLPPTPLVSYGYTIRTRDDKSHRILIVELHSEHLEQVKQFVSGVKEQDDYFREKAWNEQKAGVNKTLLFFNKGVIWGYVTYGISRIRVHNLPAYFQQLGINDYGPEPVFLIAQYAISESLQGQGIGSELLEFVKTHLMHLALELGGIGISLFCIMDNEGEKRVSFYEKAGFYALSKKPVDGRVQMFYAFDRAYSDVYS